MKSTEWFRPNKRTVGFILCLLFLFICDWVRSKCILAYCDYFKFNIFHDDWRRCSNATESLKRSENQEKLKRINEKMFPWSKIWKTEQLPKNLERIDREIGSHLYSFLYLFHLSYGAIAIAYLSLATATAFILILVYFIYYYITIVMHFYSWHFIMYGAESLWLMQSTFMTYAHRER